MTIKRAYISGPIAGHEDAEKNFRVAQRFLEKCQWTVVIPQDIPPWSHDGECPPGYRSSPDAPHAAACNLRGDIIVMLECDVVFMLPGWESSVGARLEMQVAAACGLPIRFLSKAELGVQLWMDQG